MNRRLHRHLPPTAPVLVLAAAGLFFVVLVGLGGAYAANQTPDFSPVHGEAALPFRLSLERVNWIGSERPTVHSYVTAQWEGAWLVLGGRTNGLHGMTGMGAFPTTSANSELWVLDPIGQLTWRRPLGESGLPTAVIDFLSATNHNFVQEGAWLYVAGGYGFDRSRADYVTWPEFARIDVAGLMAWVKRQPDAPVPVQSIRTLPSPLFQVTGGALERVGDHFLLVFGQNYPGRYRPHFDGTYTRQVRRFAVVEDGASLRLDPASISESAPRDEFRRRDLNVVPVLRRDVSSGSLFDEVLALAGVFTPTTGVWTVPVRIDAAGQPAQADPMAADTFKQGLHHYHSAKTTLFQRVTGENFILQFGGLSAQYRDPASGVWQADPQVPFVHHISCLVVSATGAFHQYLLSAEFPDLRSATGQRLFFGTSAEFIPSPEAPLMRPRIIDLAAVNSRSVLGHIYGGLVSDAPNGGTTHASGELFAVILEPILPSSTPLEIAYSPPDALTLNWPVEPGVSVLIEQSTDLSRWFEMRLPEATPPVTIPLSNPGQGFFRTLTAKPTSAP